ncbi:hypothetical protein HZH68_016021 [Vespula germanica]|uniref:Uncharacterized protein n=2 Tax=Vespula TaxID=7451 RepID=A0A834J4T1_VESGE|nr:hypothetical protein HZH66_014545 [Vespula vulgaris]KAF7381146.1 hypothetical protein HZH68_016021 [Vespula germanica]
MQRKGRCELKVSEYAPVSLEGVGTHGFSGTSFSIGESSFSAPREESEAEGDREILRGWWMGWKKVESDRRLVLARRWTDPSARDFCKRRDELAPDDYFVGLRD